MSVKACGRGVIVPGTSSASWPGLRPFSGSDCSVLPEMTSPTVTDCVCSTGDWPTTSTVSSSEPTSILKSSRAICLVSSAIGFVVAVLKLVSDALTT